MVQRQTKEIKELLSYFRSNSISKVFVVCGKSALKLEAWGMISKSLSEIQIFMDFSTNPLLSEAVNGIELFNKKAYDAIIAIGGGSSIDVAKYIKTEVDNKPYFIAIPTTAGSGSESTKHIVLYKDGNKLSLGKDSAIPDFVLLDGEVLRTLPLYQKKCTLMDAFCQAIESWISKGRSSESIEYSKQAISLILENIDGYINEEEDTFEFIMEASNLAGKAINITATTLAHAMSYKLTSIYGIPHGNAVAICLPVVFSNLIKNADTECKKILNDISAYAGVESTDKFVDLLDGINKKLDLKFPVATNKKEEIEILVNAINYERMANTPVSFNKDTLRKMYERILQ